MGNSLAVRAPAHSYSYSAWRADEHTQGWGGGKQPCTPWQCAMEIGTYNRGLGASSEHKGACTFHSDIGVVMEASARFVSSRSCSRQMSPNSTSNAFTPHTRAAK